MRVRAIPALFPYKAWGIKLLKKALGHTCCKVGGVGSA